MRAANRHGAELIRDLADSVFRFRRIAGATIASRRRFRDAGGPSGALAGAARTLVEPADTAAMSALDLDGALSRLSTAHLQALLSLLGPGRQTIAPPPSTH